MQPHIREAQSGIRSLYATTFALISDRTRRKYYDSEVIQRFQAPGNVDRDVVTPVLLELRP